MDLWGQGTMVTVSSESRQNPAVFLISECKAPKDSEWMALACLVTAYMPESVNVKWKTSAQNERIVNFPAVLRDKYYTMSSQLSFPAEWKTGPHNCTIHHAGPQSTKTFQMPASWNAQSKTPTTKAPTITKTTTTKATTTTQAPTTTKASITTKTPTTTMVSTTKTPTTTKALPNKTTTNKEPTTTKKSAAKAPSSISLDLLRAPIQLVSSDAAHWLLCEASGFSPPEVFVTWWEDQFQVDAVRFTTMSPVPQAGNATFQTWSVLRIPASSQPHSATYTCTIRHEASQKELNASRSVELGDQTTTLLVPQSEEENNDNYADLDDVSSLWTTLSTFVALFFLTLLYSGFVTFIKVKKPFHKEMAQVGRYSATAEK